MKKPRIALLLIIALTAIIFAACGNRTEEVYEIRDLPPYPTPAPSPEQEPSFTTFDCGVLGVKFTIDDHPAWTIFNLSSGNTNTPLLMLRPNEGDDRARNQTNFFIAEWTTHPSCWSEMFPPYEPWHGVSNWKQPSEPDEIFVTANGITVVQYVNVFGDWLREDEYAVTVLFIFRQDGRDYREIEGAQILYIGKLITTLENLGDIYHNARAMINSLQFHEGAAISFPPTEIATSLGITSYNYPRIDGSTSTVPLMNEILAAMFLPNDNSWWEYRIFSASRTIPAYELLIAGEVDMILVPEPSAHVLNLAESAGVELEFTPIAVEALVFITSDENPVSEITMAQVLEIYTTMGITNWEQLGGSYGEIIPFSRNPHSGSQTLMDNLVLDGKEIHPDLLRFEIGGMSDMLSEAGATSWWFHEDTGNADFALGYTVYFFLEQQLFWQRQWQQQGHEYNGIQMLTLDGVFPTHETIRSGEYPLSTNYFAVIRADTPQNAITRNIIEWLQTPEGQDAVTAAGLGWLS
ncbi:MAG: substrate-binding domain-containing protein [Defluviitaleaceae bacterium]|nr:substrate-binding domain-containing protein [Defluviitaleaceae bacterium]